MAKRRNPVSNNLDPHEHLFAEIEERKRRKLVLPRLLAQAAGDKRLDTPHREKAYQMICKWAEMARKGKLKRKETSIDDMFLSEVFGQALGYKGVTESETTYHRERQFSVPGVGAADGALGQFPLPIPENVRVVIELKGSKTHLDRDKSNGRTAVQQVWDYINALPTTCKWGIVSNFTTIRLYHRDKGSQIYEQFTLKEMAENRDRFNQFYALFELKGLAEGVLKQPPRAIDLLAKTQIQQKEVGDKLYSYYSLNRLRLIQHLHHDLDKPLEQSIRIAQKLLDRIIFIAFCEDRDLLPSRLIQKVCREIPYLSKATNPIWQNFLNLFNAIDKGHVTIGVENGYNGGLFRHDPLLDELQLSDDPWANFFQGISKYDYRDEVNVDVLGHLFEKSVTELERLRLGGLFGPKEQKTASAPLMPKSPQRKLFGVYYTPIQFTTAIVQYTIDELVQERFDQLLQIHGLKAKDREKGCVNPQWKAYWRACLDELKSIKVCDPACGSGAFLIQAYDSLFQHYSIIITEVNHQKDHSADNFAGEVPEWILTHNLYGVDLQPEAVEIAQLSLWLRTARMGKTLADLSKNIVCGNSLIDDPAVSDRAMDWRVTFPEVFKRKTPGFDCVIGNPPWERLKLQEREFFTFSAPKIATAVNASSRSKMIEQLQSDNPDLHKLYLDTLFAKTQIMDSIRTGGRYPLTGKGDINTYSLFAELSMRIVAPTGRVGLLVPSGISTDKTTANFFNTLMEQKRLRRLYDFENKRGLFEDVHRSFKFSVIEYGGEQSHIDEVDFVFFARELHDLTESDRHVPLSSDDMKLLNPNTKTCPIFRSKHNANLTKTIYQHIPILIDRNRHDGGNPWGLKFIRMFDQTNDSSLFIEGHDLAKKKFKQSGNLWIKGKKRYLPLYEAKMTQAFDHRAASVEVDASNWVRQAQTVAPSLVEYQNPEHMAMPRWWVEERKVDESVKNLKPYFLGFKDITSPTNQRTMIASFIPRSGVTNHFVLGFTDQEPIDECCLLANFNSMVFDYVTRQKIGGITLNFFIIEQLPTIPPDDYNDPCPWNPKQKLKTWISNRVLKLSCTANDMIPLAEACGHTPKVHKWKEAQRAQWRAELDAAYFILYKIKREDVIYILATFQGTRATDKDATLIDSQEGDPRLSPAGQLIIQKYDELYKA